MRQACEANLLKFCGTAGGSGFSHSTFNRAHAGSTPVGATNISEWLNGHG